MAEQLFLSGVAVGELDFTIENVSNVTANFIALPEPVYTMMAPTVDLSQKCKCGHPLREHKKGCLMAGCPCVGWDWQPEKGSA